MTKDRIQTAAAAAIRAMTPEERESFANAIESGNADEARETARAAAAEGLVRQFRLAETALEDPETMEGLTGIIDDPRSALDYHTARGRGRIVVSHFNERGCVDLKQAMIVSPAPVRLSDRGPDGRNPRPVAGVRAS